MPLKDQTETKQQAPGPQTQNAQPSLSIFISHCHEDKEIASLLYNTFQDWTLGKVQVFQTSAARSGTPGPGQDLTKGLLNCLKQSHVVILIYTSSEYDWSYCMWECGVATNPARPDTKIIVFQCEGDSPPPLPNLVYVKMEEESIRKFTLDFHHDPDFFPLHNAPLAPDLGPEQIEIRSKQLQKGLFHFLEKESGPNLKIDERNRWDFLRLGLDLKDLEDIENAKDWNTAFQSFQENIPQKCFITNGHGEAAKHFGVDRIEDLSEKTFLQIVNGWKERARNCPTDWIEGLYAEMTRAILKRPAEPKWDLMKSARPGVNWWVAPIINHVRIIPKQGIMEFDLYLFRIPSDILVSDKQQVGTP